MEYDVICYMTGDDGLVVHCLWLRPFLFPSAILYYISLNIFLFRKSA